MAGLPIDINQLINAGAKLKADRDLPVHFVVLVEVDADDSLVDATQADLVARTSRAFVDVAAVETGAVMRVASMVDAAIVLVGSGSHDLAPTLQDLRERAIPTVAVALRPERGELPALLGHPVGDVVVGTDPVELVRGPLADWVMDRLPEKRTAIAHNFEFVRRAVAKEAMRATAWQNALIGGVAVIPGADMPIMTLNQGKMILQMAAAYGQDLGPERVWELGVVVGGGFLFRTFARQALTLIPGFGWAVKAAVAYSGTIAMGEAAITYFEKGATLPEVIDGLKATALDMNERARSRRELRARERAERALRDSYTSASAGARRPERATLAGTAPAGLPEVAPDGVAADGAD